MAKPDVKPSIVEHELEVADDEPADFFGNRNCGACSKPGRVGDVQHPEGAPKLPRSGLAAVAAGEDWRERQAGEHLEDDL